MSLSFFASLVLGAQKSGIGLVVVPILDDELILLPPRT
jgi:hypothetical protein